MAKILFVKDTGFGQWTTVKARVQEESGKSIAITRYLKKYNDARYLAVSIMAVNFNEPLATRPFADINGFTPAQYHQAVTGLRAVYDQIYLVGLPDANMNSDVDLTPTISTNGTQYHIEVPSLKNGWLSRNLTVGTLQEVVDIAQRVPGISQVQFRFGYSYYLKCGVSTPDIMAFMLTHGEDLVRR